MRLIRASRLTAMIAATALLPLLAGCSDDDDGTGTSGTGLVGTWNATSFSIGGTDLIAQGLAVSFTFSSGGSYTISISNDTNQTFCVGSTSCTDNGSWSASGGSITFDEGTADEATFSYNVSGDTLTVSGSVEGISLSATFQRV